jgi:hypothetical protein
MLQSKDCKIKVVGDISCDINGPVACTLRSSTIAEPFYGYLPSDDKEVDVPPIVVMAVDNLPELPRMLVKALAPCLWSTLFLLLMTIKRYLG